MSVTRKDKIPATLVERIREVREKWKGERCGIGFACFERYQDRDREFAKADFDFAVKANALLLEAENEITLLKAERDGLASQLLDLQQGCIAEREKITAIRDHIQQWLDAYPEDVFPPVTKEDRAWVKANRPGLIDRCSAAMGRHMARMLLAFIRDRLPQETRSS